MRAPRYRTYKMTTQESAGEKRARSPEAEESAPKKATTVVIASLRDDKAAAKAKIDEYIAKFVVCQEKNADEAVHAGLELTPKLQATTGKLVELLQELKRDYAEAMKAIMNWEGELAVEARDLFPDAPKPALAMQRQKVRDAFEQHRVDIREAIANGPFDNDYYAIRPSGPFFTYLELYNADREAEADARAIEAYQVAAHHVLVNRDTTYCRLNAVRKSRPGYPDIHRTAQLMERTLTAFTHIVEQLKLV